MQAVINTELSINVPPNKSFERTARQFASHQHCVVSLRRSSAGEQPAVHFHFGFVLAASVGRRHAFHRDDQMPCRVTEHLFTLTRVSCRKRVDHNSAFLHGRLCFSRYGSRRDARCRLPGVNRIDLRGGRNLKTALQIALRNIYYLRSPLFCSLRWRLPLM